MGRLSQEQKDRLRAEALELLQSYRAAGIELTPEEERYYLNPPLESANTYGVATSIMTLETRREIKRMMAQADAASKKG